ncbi:sugar ABC transporter permease [haloarchaeon 3A1-DGR]|nr:sugar ABC transporter permease [haloarchaeon 3A1-DGR]
MGVTDKLETTYQKLVTGEQRKHGEIGRTREWINDHFMGVVLTPPLIVLGTLVLLPVSHLLYSSLHSTGRYTVGGAEFVGLQNYINAFQDPMFWTTLQHSVIYTIGSVTVAFLLGLAAALSINRLRSERARSTFTVLVLLAWAVPLVVTGLIWRFILHSNYGIANAVLMNLGLISERIGFITNTTPAFISVILADAWSRAPFAAIILLAGLQTIPENLYEAARVDGATDFQMFKDITLPQIKPSAGVALLIMTMFAFRTFSIVFALTQGGPGSATEVLATYIYRTGISQGQLGYAAALSVIMILITLAFITVYVKKIQKDALDTA